MGITESGLYGVLQRVLRNARKPLTCVDLYNDNLEIRDHASSPNRVSDYLGGLWRKGLVSRLPNPRTEEDASRWAYEWRHDKDPKNAVEPINIETAGRTLLNKPGIEIKENGKLIIIDLPELKITINVKN